MKRVILLSLLFPIIASCTHNPSGVSVRHIHEFDSAKNYRIDIDYPVFGSQSSPKLNEEIKRQIDSNIFEFKKFIVDFEGLSTRMLTYRFEIKTNSEQNLSIMQCFEWAVPGVERILYHHCNVNFNRVKCSFIDINDLFNGSVSYRDSLRAIVESQFSPDSICTIEPDETFENFYSSNDSIYFNLIPSENPQCDDFAFAIDKKRLSGLLK